jgi:hypothetical protein
VKENDEVLIVSPVPHEQNLFLLVPQDPHALLVQKTCGAKLLAQPCQFAVKPVNSVRIISPGGPGAPKAKLRNKGGKKQRRTGEFEFFQRFAGPLTWPGR